MENLKKVPLSITFAFAFLLFLTVILHFWWWYAIPIKILSREDIGYAWKEGTNIVDGLNPYARTLLGNLRDNDKYPTYLPFVYYFSALLQKLGFTTFRDFIYIWRPLSLIAHLITGISIFYLYIKKGFYYLGLAILCVFFLGRWSSYIIMTQHLEFLAVLFLIGSLLYVDRRPLIAGILFGGSICIKHLGIIFLPLIIINFSLFKKENFLNFKNYLIGFLGYSLPICLPLFLQNPKAFFASLLFPITRVGSAHGLATGSNPIMFGDDGAKVFCYFLIICLYFISIKKKLPIFTSCLIAVLIFLQFNTIIFAQYYYWLVTFLIIAIIELLPHKNKISFKNESRF